MSKSSKLGLLFASMSITGTVLLVSIVAFEELQNAYLVYLGFILLIFGSFALAFVALKQDSIDNTSQSFTGVGVNQ